MGKQISLSGLSDELEQGTKKKEFLSQIERIVPSGEWLTLIRPYYYKGEHGNKHYDLEWMLRLYLLQNLMLQGAHWCGQGYLSGSHRCGDCGQYP